MDRTMLRIIMDVIGIKNRLFSPFTRISPGSLPNQFSKKGVYSNNNPIIKMIIPSTINDLLNIKKPLLKIAKAL
jgi:hypothetical protein